MNISYTGGKYDVYPSETEYNNFEHFCKSFIEMCGNVEPGVPKEQLFMICVGNYKGKVSISNFRDSEIMIFDFDKNTKETWQIDLYNLHRLHNFSYLAFETPSSTLEVPKYKIIIPLREKVTNKIIYHNLWSKISLFFTNNLSPIDISCKDVARRHFIPRGCPVYFIGDNYLSDLCNSKEDEKPSELVLSSRQVVKSTRIGGGEKRFKEYVLKFKTPSPGERHKALLILACKGIEFGCDPSWLGEKLYGIMKIWKGKDEEGLLKEVSDAVAWASLNK